MILRKTKLQSDSAYDFGHLSLSVICLIYLSAFEYTYILFVLWNCFSLIQYYFTKMHGPCRKFTKLSPKRHMRACVEK